MKKHILFLYLLFIQLFSFGGSVITDSTFLHNQIVTGIDNASYIFEGEVVAVQSYFNDEGNYIYSSNTVKIFQTWKGFETIEEIPEEVEVITRGGTVGNTSLSISHNPEFNVGQKGMFLTDQVSTYSMNLDSEVDEDYHMQLHDGLYFDYDYSKAYVTAHYYTINFECIDILYESIDPNYVGDCLGIEPNGILQQQTYDNFYSLSVQKQQNVQLTSGTITYTFENEKTTSTNGTNFYEFDIYVESSQSVYFDNGLTRIEYNTAAFGSDVIANNKVTVQRGDVMASVNDYDSPAPGDISTNVFAVGYAGKFNAQNRYFLAINTPEKLAHVKIEIADCSQLPDLKFVDHSTMLLLSFYTGTASGTNLVNWDNIVATDVSNSALCQMSINSITPTVVNGGAGTTNSFNIMGNFFGTTPGTVEMKNADDGGKTWLKLDDFDVLWGANSITINTPSDLNISGTPGTGEVRITNSAGSSITSSNVVTIEYSWKNHVIPAANPNQVLFKRPVFLSGIDLVFNEDQQTQNLGYQFIPNANILNNTPALNCVQEALSNWTCATEIRWELGSTAQNLPSTDDGFSMIRFGTTASNNVLGETETWVDLCQVGMNSITYVTNIDIVILDSPTSPYFYDETGTLPQPANHFDFYAIILHELGHGGLMNHVNDPTDIMYYQSKHDPLNSISATNRYLPFSLPNLDGGAFIVERSSKVNYANCNSQSDPIVPLKKSNCVVSLKENALESAFTDLRAYPNPVSDQLSINFKLKRKQALSIEVYDLSGKLLILQEKKMYQEGTNTISISTDNLSAGIYFVKVKAKNNYFKNLKIIKSDG